MTQPKPSVGISACLLGQKVRYDGEHKRDEWLVRELSRFVKWSPVCPEVEMGMGVPRESVYLARDSARSRVRMLGNQSGTDYTEIALQTAQRLLRQLPEIDGYVFKKSSPSCGVERVRVFGPKEGPPDRTGRGLFAAALIEALPGLPVIEEGRLSDPVQREHFVLRVFAYRRWKEVPARLSAIQKFHEAYKLLLMAHSPVHYQKLGRIAANSGKAAPSEVKAGYGRLFHEGLAVPSTAGRRANVFQHVVGYFRKELPADERRTIQENIDEYRRGELSYLAVLTVIRNTVRRLRLPYLEGQAVFDPYPKELGLAKYL